MRYQIVLLAIIAFPLFNFAAQLSGTVRDDKGETLPFAVVFVKGTSIGTTTNADGVYQLELAPGNYILGFQLIGFQLAEKSIQVAASPIQLDATLNTAVFALREMKIIAGAEDPAYEVIRQAQKKRKYFLNQVEEYSCNVFIKGMEKITKYPPKKIAGAKVTIGGLIDSTSGIVYLSESESRYFFKQPNKVHEEMIASKTSGKKNGFSYNRASDMDFNFYQTAVKNAALSDRGFVSPIAPAALRIYRYKLLGTFQEGNEMVNKIQVMPKHPGDAAFTGTIYIIENSWRIHSTDLYIDKSAGIDFVDTLRIKQEYIKLNDSIWMPLKNNFEYTFGGFGLRGIGVYNAINSNYSFKVPEREINFGAETITFHKDALSRDSAYWQSHRAIPVTTSEVKDFHKRDSIVLVQSSYRYIDSTEHVKNKFKWNNLIDGYSYESSLRKEKFKFESMLENVSFNTVQGLVLTPTILWEKQLAQNKDLEIGATGGYGWSNKKYYGFGHTGYTYNRRKFSVLTLHGGKDMLQFNNNAISPIINSLYTLLLRENFMKLFEKYFVRLEHSTELFNGFVFYAATEYADRNPLLNTTDFSLIKSNKEFQQNDPLLPGNPQFAFFRNQSFHIEGAFQFTPFQPYYFNDNRKIIKESNHPTFTIYYKKAIPGVYKSDVDLDVLKAGCNGAFFWKRIGVFRYTLEAGQFVNRTQMSFMDYTYFNGNRTLYSDFSGKQFQLLDYYTNSTKNRYAQMHLQQNFNGFFMNKIPLLKRAKIQEIVSCNLLLTAENVQYAELGVGLQKMFVRVDYVFGFRNGIYNDSSLRFGFLF